MAYNLYQSSLSQGHRAIMYQQTISFEVKNMVPTNTVNFGMSGTNIRGFHNRVVGWSITFQTRSTEYTHKSN